jgi:Rieske Fe-S protein
MMEPIDFMPFSGRNPGSKNTYIHTGDSGQGITNAVAGSLTILPLILGEESRFAALLAPSRKSISIPSLKEFAQDQAGAAKNFAEYVTPGEISSADELSPGEGAVVREGLSKIAVYKASDGKITRHSAICTHLGCLVHWNGLEQCWDCPCHGSQFATDGEVLNGPAVRALANADSSG